jgi:NADH-quinone oxidoreductase subunit C
VSKNKVLDFVSVVKQVLAEQIESAEAKDEQYVSIVVKNGSLLDAAQKLRKDFGYVIPIACGGVDYPDDNRMQVIYYLSHPENRFIVTLRVNLPRDDPHTPSLTQVWEAVSFHERETHEMFGVEFEEHPNMVPLLLPPNWRGGFPLRKDFKGEGVTE